MNVITTHPYSVRHGGASSDALWRTRSLIEIQKRGRWRSEKSVRRYEKHSRLLTKLSDATRKYGQPVMSRMSRLLCDAMLHSIFKHAQRQSRDGWFFLRLGGSDQLVGSQIARLSSLGVVILSEVLSPGFDLNSPIVRNVLRGWIACGGIAAVWMTQPLALSTVVWKLFNKRKLLVSLRSSTATRLVSLLCFSKCWWMCVCFWLADQETFYAVLCQRSGTLEAGSTLWQLW